LPQYKDFSHPFYVEKEFKRRFTKGLIFCCNMGDLWADMTPFKVIQDVLNVVRNSPHATFLMLTKNPKRYRDVMYAMPPNVILGVTIETDHYPSLRPGELIGSKESAAPSPMNRALHMWDLKREHPGVKTMVCVEPIMDFDLWTLAPLIMGIKPLYVYIGYDNHKHKLVEPELAKTQKLIEILQSCTEVRTKTLRERWDG